MGDNDNEEHQNKRQQEAKSTISWPEFVEAFIPLGQWGWDAGVDAEPQQGKWVNGGAANQDQGKQEAGEEQTGGAGLVDEDEMPLLRVAFAAIAVGATRNGGRAGDGEVVSMAELRAASALLDGEEPPEEPVRKALGVSIVPATCHLSFSSGNGEEPQYVNVWNCSLTKESHLVWRGSFLNGAYSAEKGQPAQMMHSRACLFSCPGAFSRRIVLPNCAHLSTKMSGLCGSTRIKTLSTTDGIVRCVVRCRLSVLDFPTAQTGLHEADRGQGRTRRASGQRLLLVQRLRASEGRTGAGSSFRS